VKLVAVLGGGPAGSMAAAGLASAGVRTVLFDEKLAWEKPCGGGITYKAYRQYPFLLDNAAPKKKVTEARLSEPRGGTVTMRLRHPLLIYSRRDLNQLLLDRAARAGAQIERERVLAAEPREGGWRVRTRSGTLDADYLVLATGARNSLRHLGTEWKPHDTMCALGYYVPETRPRVDIQFFPNFEGYIWVFPRTDHLSVGICGKGVPSQKARQLLHDYMDAHGIPRRDARFYAHLIPALERPSWRSNRICGPHWVAAGDAAGLVDPVTGEGLFYAIRSGDLAAQAILHERLEPGRRHAVYDSLLRGEFLEDLVYGAGLAKRFFLQEILFSSVPARMIELMRHSARMRDIVQDLFAGTQRYLDLKDRILGSLNGTMKEILFGAMLGHQVAREG
jgi:geranylgeranyl reductase family protein